MLNHFMIIALLALPATLSQASEVCEADTCIFVNSAYNGPHTWQKSQVIVFKNAAGETQMSLNIPCGSKLTPRLLAMYPTSSISGDLQVIDEGSSQCFIGLKPTYIRVDNDLVIQTHSDVQTPNFDGSYTFTLESH